MSSAGTIDADVNITINADDHATVQVESAAKRINRQWREMRLEQRAVQQSFELSNRKFTATARVLGQMGTVMLRLQSVFNTYQLMQIRGQDTARNLAEANRRVTESIIEHGHASQEAIQAQEQADEMKRQSEQEGIDRLIGIGTMAGVLATTVGRIPGLTGAIKTLGNVLKGGKGPGTPKITDFTKGGGGGGLGGAVSRGLGGIGGAIGGALGKVPIGGLGAGGIGAGVMFLSNIPPAGDPIEGYNPDPYGWNKFTGEAGNAFNATVNVFANTSQEIVDEIQTAIDGIFRFDGN